MTRHSLLRNFGRVAVLSSLLLLTGCLSMGHMGGAGTMADILLGGGRGGGGVNDSRDLRGEIRNVDTRRQTIHISTGWRTEQVRYDRSTRVSYGNRRYNVRDLRRGDLVRVRLDRDRRRGTMYTRQIQLQDRQRDNRRDRRNRGRNWFSFDEAFAAPAVYTVKEKATEGS